jgi:hypothetical protein
MGTGHMIRTIATEDHISNRWVSSSDHCCCDWACLPTTQCINRESQVIPTSLSKMKTDNVKNSYCPKATRVDSGRKDYINSIQIDWSWYNLILYSQSLQFFAVAKRFKRIPYKLHFREFKERRMLHIHSSNWWMTSSDHCYQWPKVAMGVMM